MKKMAKIILPLILTVSLLTGILALTACRNNPEEPTVPATEEISQDDANETVADGNGDESENTLFETSAAIPRNTGTPLTDEKLNDIMETLPCIVREEHEIRESSLVPPCSRFLSSYYADVRYLNFDSFMRYLPPLRVVDEKGFSSSEEELQDLYGAGTFYEASNKYLAADVENVLQTYAGIGLGDLHKDFRSNCHGFYSEKYDAIYTYTTDHDEDQFVVSGGERIGDKIYLYGHIHGNDILVLTETPDGGYWFVSHLPDSEYA